MMGKTHIAIGVASALLVTMPTSRTGVIAAIVGGALGSVMADVDVKIDTSNNYARKASMDALYGEIAAIALSASLLAVDFVAHGGLCASVVGNPTLAIAGAIGLAALIAIGENSEHRDRTHSILFMVLSSVAAVLINMQIGIAFFIGYASHLLIDLLNKREERLFYPLKKGVCFSVCYADRLGNELLFALGLSLAVAYVVTRIVL